MEGTRPWRGSLPSIVKHAPAACGYGFAALLLLRLSTSRLRELVHQGPDQWRMGDWLINDSGGFVRRGLIGELALRWNAASGPGAVWRPIFELQVISYGIFFFFATRMWSRARAYLPLSLLFFSPAFLAFPMLSWLGGFRKEVLHFALFSVVCASWAASGHARRAWAAVAATALLFPLLVLCHEAIFAVLPYYLLLVWFSLRGARLRARLAASALVTAGAVAALGASLSHRGTVDQERRICGSLRDRGFDPGVCNGAIAWLPDSVAVCHARVVELTSHPGYAVRAVVALLLLTAPLAYIVRDFWRFASLRPAIVMSGLAIAASFLTMVPIAWAALDWGRLLYIQYVTATLLLFALASRSGAIATLNERRRLTGRRLAVFFAALFAYSGCWSLQYCEGLVDFGLSGRAALAIAHVVRVGRPEAASAALLRR